MSDCTQIHDFRYLVKKDGNEFLIQVLEIPGVIIGGTNIDEIKSKISEITKNYLSCNETVHSKAQEKKLTSSLKTSGKGIVIGIENFQVRC